MMSPDDLAAASVQSTEGLVLVMFLVLALKCMLFVFVLLILFFKPWIQALMSGSPVSNFAMIGMRLRGSPAEMLIQPCTILMMGGVGVEITDVERTYIASRTRVHNAQGLADIVEREQKVVAS